MEPKRRLGPRSLEQLRRVSRVNVSTLVMAGALALIGCGGSAKHAGTTPTPERNKSPSPTGSAAVRADRLPLGMMTTVAGGGDALGDGGPATAGSLCAPTDVARAATGDLFVADYGNDCGSPGGNRVRKIAAGGTISTVAGGDLPGYSGDGGPAAKAQLNVPFSVAVDAAGDLYIADADNARIRKVDPRGVMSTFAGTGQRGYSGDGGPARGARLTEPLAVAVDARGNVYVADFAVVRKIDRSGTITTVAGTGHGFGHFDALDDPSVPTRFSGAGGQAIHATLNPTDVAVDRRGDLYIADGHWVHRVGRDGRIRRVAGTASGRGGRHANGIPATAATIGGPSAISVDSPGNLFISDYTTGRVREVDRHGTIRTVAGDGGANGRTSGRATAVSLLSPFGLAADHGMLYIAETHGGRVRALHYRSFLDRRHR